MSTIYRYGIQQRTPPTTAPGGFIRDVSVTNPSAALITQNEMGIADVAAEALQNQWQGGNIRIIVFREATDGGNNVGLPMNFYHAYPMLTQAGLDKVLAEFDAEIATTAKPPRHHGHK